MEAIVLDKVSALSLLREPSPEPHLVQHGLASEAVMRALARHFGEDEELWGLTGLLHDWDYPLTASDPASHGLQTAMRLQGILPDAALQAIRAHNAECNGSTVQGRFDVALRCAETVTGLVSTAALVRPTGMEGMQVSSLKKKMKDKAFAASVNREIIRQCTDMGLELDEFLAISIAAMEAAAADLGLNK